MTESSIQNERKIKIFLEKLESLIKTWMLASKNLQESENLPTPFKQNLQNQIKQISHTVFYFLEGYLWEPFESNKTLVLQILGYLVNQHSELLEYLWTRIDGIALMQFTNNVFQKSSLLHKGKSNLVY